MQNCRMRQSCLKEATAIVGRPTRHSNSQPNLERKLSVPFKTRARMLTECHKPAQNLRPKFANVAYNATIAAPLQAIVGELLWTS